MNGLAWTSDFQKHQSGSKPVEYFSFVWPVDDLIEHHPYDLYCPCLPEYKLTIGAHDLAFHNATCICLLHEVIHSSLDGRELFE